MLTLLNVFTATLDCNMYQQRSLHDIKMNCHQPDYSFIDRLVQIDEGFCWSTGAECQGDKWTDAKDERADDLDLSSVEMSRFCMDDQATPGWCMPVLPHSPRC